MIRGIGLLFIAISTYVVGHNVSNVAGPYWSRSDRFVAEPSNSRLRQMIASDDAMVRLSASSLSGLSTNDGPPTTRALYSVTHVPGCVPSPSTPVEALNPLERDRLLDFAASGRGTILSYRVRSECLQVLVIGSDGADIVDLGLAAPIADLVRQFRLRIMLQRDADRVGRALYDLLIAPVASRLDGARLVIDPSPGLDRLPFAALRSPKGTYLIEDFNLSMVDSLNRVSGQRARRGAGSATLVIGDPDYGSHDERLARLWGAEREVTVIRDVLGPAVTSVSGENVNRALFEDGSLARYRIIHFAGHGTPEGIPLSDNQRLTAADIRSLNLSASRLVVLAACSSAVGPTEGTEGLTGAFLSAGVSNVIGSLWPVSDEATADLMSAFYQEIVNRRSPGDALRSAAARMRHSTRWAQPYYWAGFVLFGDADPQPVVR